MVVTVNMVPAEDSVGVKMMERRKYNFVNLTTPDKLWTLANWNVKNYGTNYLLDPDGRVIFKPDVGDAEGQRVFEQQIEALLTKSPGR